LVLSRGAGLENARFPQDSVVRELNYRGDLLFRQQACWQAEARTLRIVDGWTEAGPPGAIMCE